MKKSLLLLSTLGISIFVNAQELTITKNPHTALKNKINVTNRVKVEKSQLKGGVDGTFAGCDNTLGSSANSFTSINGSRTNLWADPTLNTVMFVHRANPAGGVGASSGEYYFDISKDGGATWTNDVGPIYSNAANDFRGRYPQAVLYNPSGNTNPDNASVGAFGAVTDGANWVGYIYGHGSCGPTLNAAFDTAVFVDPGFKGSIPSGMHMDKNGTAYNVDYQADGISGNPLYLDGLYFYKGTWDNTNNKYNYARSFIPLAMDDDGSGALIFSEVRTAFNDNGSVGYISALGHSGDPTFACAPNAYLPVVLKTTDGGATWSGTMINLNNMDSLFGATLPAGFFWSLYAEHDIAVDANNNLHIFADVHPEDPNQGFDVTPGNFMMADIYTTDQGTTWKARLINYTMTFDGEWDDNAGATAADRLRPSVARTWNGDKLFFVYFDTDTTVFAGVGNTLPNAYCMGYDINTGMTTPVVNLTAGSLAESACIIGNLSYYVFGNTGAYSLPITYQELSTTAGGNPSVGTPCTHHYVCGDMNDNMFTVTDNSIFLSTCSITGLAEQLSSLSLATPYPNPTHDVINIPVILSSKSSVKIDITNTLGQIVKTVSATDVAGEQTIQVKVNGFAKGMYFVTVTADGKASTAKFSVE